MICQSTQDRFVALQVEDNNETGEVQVFMEYIRGVNLLECFFEGSSGQVSSEEIVLHHSFTKLFSSISALHSMNICTVISS